MKEQFEMHFDGKSPATLERTRLVTRDAGGVVWEVVSRWEEVSHPQEPHFRWGKGAKTLCLALVRLRLVEMGVGAEPLLTGRVGSAAATLDNLVHKADSMTWLREMLSSSGANDAKQRLLGWFDRKNSQFNNRHRPIRIFAGRGAKALGGEGLRIWVAGVEAGREHLISLEADLAQVLEEKTAGDAGPAAAG